MAAFIAPAKWDLEKNFKDLVGTLFLVRRRFQSHVNYEFSPDLKVLIGRNEM